VKPAELPEDLHPLFAQALNAGNVDALSALYDPQGFLLAERGLPAQGTGEIRTALARYVATDAHIELTTRAVFRAADTALLIGEWQFRRTGPDGCPVLTSGTSLEVVRRQPDGTWRYLIDLPYGFEHTPPQPQAG
jgi:ketosteroid isomerase-like protein